MARVAGWKEYQGEVATFLSRLGFETQVGEVIRGARGQHEIDVTARTETAGVRQLWIVECKQWKRAVPKERALTFLGIVQDIGADRGLIFSESGFQAGAISVTQNTNVSLTSIGTFEDDLGTDVNVARARAWETKIAAVMEAFSSLWNLPKDEREAAFKRYVGPIAFPEISSSPSNSLAGIGGRLASLKGDFEQARLGKWPVTHAGLDRHDHQMIDILDWEGLFFIAEHTVATAERIYQQMVGLREPIEDWRELIPDEYKEVLVKLFPPEG